MGAALHPVDAAVAAAVLRAEPIHEIDFSGDKGLVAIVPRQHMPCAVDDATALGAVDSHHHAQLIVQCARLHDAAKALGVPRMIFRMPSAVIAHDGQQQKVRAIEADHPRGFGGRGIHTNIAPDPTD